MLTVEVAVSTLYVATGLGTLARDIAGIRAASEFKIVTTTGLETPEVESLWRLKSVHHRLKS